MGSLALASNKLVARQNAEPMIEMNTTPLIDVMLVLLVMLIITIPPQSHKVGIDLPGDPPPLPQPLQLVNDLTLSKDGTVAWNGKSVSDAALRSLLAASGARTEQPEIHFRPDPEVAYARVDQILALAAQSGVKRFGFVGNERYSNNF